MSKKDEIRYFDSENVEIDVLGEKWVIKDSWTAGERNRLLSEHTVVHQDGTSVQDTAGLIGSLIPIFVIEVPESVKLQYKEKFGKRWKNVAECTDKLPPKIWTIVWKEIDERSGVSAPLEGS